MNRAVRAFIPMIIGLLMVAVVFMVVGVEAGTEDIEINGLYWGDGDYQDYIFRQESEPNGRGFLYANRLGDTIYALVRVSYTANDNAFKPVKDSYLASVGWSPGHALGALRGSDHLAIFLECDGDRWEWKQDLLYDADPTAGLDWRSDVHGPDGAPVTSSTGADIPVGLIIASHSSLEYNLRNSSWILITQTNASANPDDWMSLDLEPLGTISMTDVPTNINTLTGEHEDYPFFRSTGADPGDLYEWEISYEMALDVSHCEGGVLMGADSAHNSPAKDGDEDIGIPTAITLTAISASSGRSIAPAMVIGVALLVVTALVSVMFARSAKSSRRA
jgi:hypothetical protein